MISLLTSAGACKLLCSVLFGVQPVDSPLTAPTILKSDSTRVEESRIGPLAEDLSAPSEIEKLERWLTRTYPMAREAANRNIKAGLMRREYWSGTVTGSTQPCEGKMAYVDGVSVHPTLDLILVGPQNDQPLTFRSTILFSHKQRADFYLPKPFELEKWIDLIPELNSEVFVSAEKLVLRSRPILEELAGPAFFTVGFHEITLTFSPARNPVSLTGRELKTGRTLSCEFTPHL